jgi:hypothetical protein
MFALLVRLLTFGISFYFMAEFVIVSEHSTVGIFVALVLISMIVLLLVFGFRSKDLHNCVCCGQRTLNTSGIYTGVVLDTP